jgi:hypothetical protein
MEVNLMCRKGARRALCVIKTLHFLPLSLYLGGSTRLDLFFQTKGQPSSEIGHPHIAFEAHSSDVLY